MGQALCTNKAKLAEFRNDLEKLVEIYFDDNRMRQDYLLTRAVKN
jgi:hypothetical protein